MRPLVALPLLACAVGPAAALAATTTTSVAIRAGSPARLLAVPAGGSVSASGVRLDRLNLVDASGGRRGWTVTAAAQPLHDGAQRLPAGSLALDGTTPLDGGAAVLLGRGGGGRWRPAAGRALRVAVPPGVPGGRYVSTVTLTLAVGP